MFRTIILFGSWVPLLLMAQVSEALQIGQVHQLRSTSLNEVRELNVVLPDGFHPDTIYLVVYLLDGSKNEDLLHVAGLMQFLTMIGKMEPSILVGIANVDRKRDFTSPTRNVADQKAVPTAGGSKRFIPYLTKEVPDHIRSLYKIKPGGTVIGQSLGGLLLTEVLIEQQASFNNYIIVSPSLWWDDGSLLQRLQKEAASIFVFPTKVIIMVGKEGDQMETDARALATILKSVSTGTVDLVHMPEEDHLTILHNALYKAFLMLDRSIQE
jgi:predicted alpha/beta superfamily hydrolase